MVQIINFPNIPNGLLSNGMTIYEYNFSLLKQLQPEKARLFSGIIMNSETRREVEDRVFRPITKPIHLGEDLSKFFQRNLFTKWPPEKF